MENIKGSSNALSLADNIPGFKSRVRAVPESPPDAPRISFFKTGPDEYQGFTIEDLLMKLALAEAVIQDMMEWHNHFEENGGDPGGMEFPGTWAIAGVHKNLSDVKHALKCGCWGHQEAFNH